MRRISGIGVRFVFCDGSYEVRQQHACGSCGLSDEEWHDVDKFNEGLHCAIPVMEQMETEIMELRTLLVLAASHD